jgi:hypothetical protein
VQGHKEGEALILAQVVEATSDAASVGSYILVSAKLGRIHVTNVARWATLLRNAHRWVRIEGKDHKPTLIS